jgi:hypothetical protein
VVRAKGSRRGITDGTTLELTLSGEDRAGAVAEQSSPGHRVWLASSVREGRELGG